ncbi:MAG: M20/M25/M40 family metallo-hydrolase [Anaerolineae bacterium]
MSAIDWDAVRDEAVRHLQQLIRFNTTNPPGNETPAAQYVAGILKEERFEPTLLESEPGRGNVVTRLKGNGQARPLLLLSHLDVVPAEADRWTHPPFSGLLVDNFVWGRGALDMKGTVVMQLMTMLLLKRQKVPLARDVILAVTADEEMGGFKGIGWLVDNHLELVEAEYALSEFGGFSMTINGKRFYPCQTAEKGVCWVRLKATGQPGHGSMPHPDNAVLKVARAVERLGRAELPLHHTASVTRFIQDMAREQSFVRSLFLRGVLNPTFSSFILNRLFPDKDQARSFHAMLHNTATPTQLKAGIKTNVIPSEAEAMVDGRLLPGQDQESFLAELRAVVGHEVELEVDTFAPPLQADADTPLFQAMAAGIHRHDAEGIVLPMLIPAATDAKHLARQGITCYGFSPMQLPPDFPFMRLAHGHDERIPVDALLFGTRVLYDVVADFCQVA